MLYIVCSITFFGLDKLVPVCYSYYENHKVDGDRCNWRSYVPALPRSSATGNISAFSCLDGKLKTQPNQGVPRKKKKYPN